MNYILFIIFSCVLFGLSAQSNPDDFSAKNYCSFSSNANIYLYFGSRIDAVSGEKAAIDIGLSAYERFTTTNFEMRANVVGGIEKIDFIVWSNLSISQSENIPDTIMSQQLNLFPVNQDLMSTMGNIEVYDLDFELPIPLELTAGPSNTTFWVQVVAYPVIAGEMVLWTESSGVIDNTLALVPQGDTDWILTGTDWPYSTPRESVYKLVGDCVSTLELSEESDLNFTIYPNPITDKLHIETVFSLNTEAVQLLDFMGNSIDFTMYDNAVDCSGISPGIYYLTVSNGQRILTKKVVKI